MSHFSGSYKKSDVNFLLKKINMESTSIEEKEGLIQSEKSHYSEFFTRELEPSKEYFELFWESVNDVGPKMAEHCLMLAEIIKKESEERNRKEITLVSLVRAGTPIGVILKRIYDLYYPDLKVSHYSVSIIRDKGIDAEAMKTILSNHSSDSICFIDGWTGKGVISQVLKDSMLEFNEKFNHNVNHNLYVLADLAGVAYKAATSEDYLIPSSILNSTVSGLVSRSILNDKYIHKGDYHGCVYYKEYEGVDISLEFVEKIMEFVEFIKEEQVLMKNLRDDFYFKNKSNKDLIEISKKLLESMKRYHNIKDINLIKPGIGEATRVLLRRVPDVLWVKDQESNDVAQLIKLAHEKKIKIKVNRDLPYNAVAIIKDKR